MKTKNINITQDEENPVEQNVLANSIVEISNSMKKIINSGLTFDAIVILTQHNCVASKKRGSYGTKPSIAQVRNVLKSLDDLKRRYTTLR